MHTRNIIIPDFLESSIQITVNKYSNHLAVKKRICYKDRLKTHDLATITSIIEGRMKVEIYRKDQYLH